MLKSCPSELDITVRTVSSPCQERKHHQGTDPVTNQARQITFNGDNKQVEVKDANGNAIGKYYYDGEGKRVKKVTATETTIFVYSVGKLAAEYSTQISQNPTTSYTTADHLGSPRVITDKTGNIKSRRDFMPFGEDIFVGVGGRTGATGQRYSSSADDIRQKFTGYQKDSETNLDFAEARMYENRHGRFTAVDPLIASGKSANPQTFNRYVYVGNSPLVITDPLGMIGDYYNRNGFWLGHDGKNDGKVYFAVEYGRTKGNRVILDRRTTEETTIEEVLRVQNTAVPLIPGTETTALNEFGAGGVQGTADVTNGVPKGIGNFFIDSANSFTDLLVHNSGIAPLPDFVPNPFEIKRFTFSTWKEAMYGNAGYTATVLAPSVAGGPFAASKALSVVPEEFAANPSALSQVQINRASGNALRDEIAGALTQEGRQVTTEVYKRTPFGKRFIDIEVSHNGQVLGGIETKFGGARYRSSQRAKDFWLRYADNYIVSVVRSQ